jgi:hypothetical protein
MAALLLPAFALAGCAAPEEKKIEENIYPKDYKAEILTYVNTQAGDPSGIRDAFISEPALVTAGAATRYIACMRYTPKEDGKYAGIREMAVYYYAGRMTQMVKATPDLCGKAVYQPFPELQALCRGVSCQQRR